MKPIYYEDLTRIEGMCEFINNRMEYCCNDTAIMRVDGRGLHGSYCMKHGQRLIQALRNRHFYTIKQLEDK